MVSGSSSQRGFPFASATLTGLVSGSTFLIDLASAMGSQLTKSTDSHSSWCSVTQMPC